MNPKLHNEKDDEKRNWNRKAVEQARIHEGNPMGGAEGYGGKI